jgi:hypothetical protein
VPPLPVTYRLEPRPRTAEDLAKRFVPVQLDILEMLNRRDREHLIRPDPPTPGLVVPSQWVDDPLAYSPFPAFWPGVEGQPKFLVVHQPAQAFAAYEQGHLVRWGPVSSGRKETPTPSGLFNLTWRARSRRSTDNQDWLLEWYFNFVNERGVSFHLFDLPGYPASHACVRLLRRDAEWLYRWGEQWILDDSRRHVVTAGTPVLILGVYRYDAPPPWVSIETLAQPIDLPERVPAQGGPRDESPALVRGRTSPRGARPPGAARTSTIAAPSGFASPRESPRGRHRS